MKIDITPKDLEQVIADLMHYCHLMEVVEAEYGFTEETKRETETKVAEVKELASRLQANRIIR